jgi:hypothetical protein
MFYLNPKTNLLGPIGFDLGSQFKNKASWYLSPKNMESFYHPFYDSKKFVKALQLESLRLSKTKYMKAFLTSCADEMKRNIKFLHVEKSNCNSEVLFKNQRLIERYSQSY